MDPSTFTFIQQFGLPLVAAVALAYVYYRSQQDVVRDLRQQRDAANARADGLIEGMRSQTSSMQELTTIVRQAIGRIPPP